MKKIAVFASGEGTNFEALVKYTRNQNTNYEVTLLVTNNPGANCCVRAQTLGISYVAIPYEAKKGRVWEKAVHQHLKEKQITFLVLAGFMRILSAIFVQTWVNKIVNIHPSLLPSYPGQKVIVRQFNDKKTCTGITIHFVDKGVDTGQIIFQHKIKIKPSASLKEWKKVLRNSEHFYYPRVLEKMFKSKTSGII